MKRSLITFFLFFSLTIYSQQDSLKNYSKEQLFEKAETRNNIIYLDEIFKRNLTNTELLDYYEKYIRLAYQTGNYQKSKLQSLELLKFSQKEKNTHYELVATLSLLEVEFVFQNYENCEKYYLLTKNIVKKLPESTDKFVAGMDADFFYYLSGDFKKYSQLMENSIYNLKKQDTKNLKKKDLEYLQYVTAASLIYLADSYVMVQDFKKANLRLSEGEEILNKNFADETITFSMKAKLVEAKLLLFQKKFNESISVLEKTLKLAEQNKFDDVKYQSQVFMAMNYFNTENYQKSLFYAESAIENPQKVADFIDFDLEAKRYGFLASKKLKLKDRSLHYADLFINENNEVKNQKRRSFVNQIIKNNYVEDVQNKKNTLKYYLLTFIIISLFSLALVYFFQKKKIKKQYEQFQKIITELKNTKNNIAETKIELKSQKNKELSDEKLLEIIKKLEKFEKGKLFLKPEMSLAFLAGHLQTNVNTLSSIINQSKSQNFNDYINTLRINYIIEKLQNDSKYRNFKISSLAEECGFSSHSVFTVAFKKRTKMNPSQFISFLKN